MLAHEKRVIEEYSDLNSRIASLDFFIDGSYEFEGLSDEEKSLLLLQSQVMHMYAGILERRIAKIDNEK